MMFSPLNSLSTLIITLLFLTPTSLAAPATKNVRRTIPSIATKDGEYTIIPILITPEFTAHTCVVDYLRPNMCSVTLVTGDTYKVGNGFTSAIFHYNSDCQGLNGGGHWGVTSQSLNSKFWMGGTNIWLKPSVSLEDLLAPPNKTPLASGQINVNFGRNAHDPEEEIVGPQPDPFVNPANRVPWLFRDKVEVGGKRWVTVRMPYYCGKQD